MQRNRTEPERTLNIYWTLRLKSNLQELGAHGCVSSSPSPDSWHRRHLPSPWDSCYKICISIFCFQIAFSILSVCQAYRVHLSFQNAFLSKPSKITSYCNWSLLCWCISYFLGWCDFFFFFSGSITLHHFFLPLNSQLIHLKWLMCDQQFTSRSKRCSIWSFERGMSTASQRSIMFCSSQSCHMSIPYTSNDNLVPKQLPVSSFWGVKPWKHLKQISRDCSPLNLWIFLYSVWKKRLNGKPFLTSRNLGFLKQFLNAFFLSLTIVI